MENNNDLKEKIQEFLKIPGRTKGASLIAANNIIKQAVGEKKFAEIEALLLQSGCAYKISELKDLEWYPVGLLPTEWLIMHKVLGWDKAKIEEVSRQAARVSLIEKLFSRYFLSPEKTYQMAPKEWQKHFDIGKLETPELNLKDKYFILRLKDFKTSPLHCAALGGWFKAIAQLVVKTEEMHCKETKCVFRGDPYHEFVIRWQ